MAGKPTIRFADYSDASMVLPLERAVVDATFLMLNW
jgi:hypothetical protein